ncbi:MAG: glycosyltransferase [Candidatus Cloacimonetes bacterium]|nr:glycosyltransferase [Candidatus Cloacimonadota bacterium]
MTLLLYFAIFYTVVIFFLVVGLLKRSSLHKNISRLCEKNVSNPTIHIAVIIACKNEEQNIEKLINSLKDQSYSKDSYDVILADDTSTDATAEKIKHCIEDWDNFHYLYVDQNLFPDLKGKKKAISYAVDYLLNNFKIPFSKDNKILAFTDADCTPEKDWLLDINHAFINGCDFYAGFSPIINNIEAKKDKEKLSLGKRLAINLKKLERASIFAVSAGSFGLGIPLTCTARNIAYKLSIWLKTEGFKGIGHILSGDDDLMLHKSRHFIDKYYFSFNPNAFVYTNEEMNLSKYINQETRRTSKFFHYPLYIKLLIFSVAIFYFILMYNIIISIIFRYFHLDLFVSLILKILIEFTLLTIFLIKVKHFNYLWCFLIAELLYLPYFIFFGLKGTLGKYKWKN